LLKSVVEADETYVGGKSRKMIPGRGSERKTPVIAVIERDGKAISKPVDKVDGKTLKGKLQENLAPSAIIHTDTWRGYRGTEKLFAGHLTVNHGHGEYARDGVYVNQCESYFALLKRGVHGTFHHISRKHMARYCNEFSFRWNNRKT